MYGNKSYTDATPRIIDSSASHTGSYTMYQCRSAGYAGSYVSYNVRQPQRDIQPPQLR